MSDSKPGKFQIGDVFPVDLIGEADCPAETSRIGFPAACILDEGHDGQHVAVGFEGAVVEAWD